MHTRSFDNCYVFALQNHFLVVVPHAGDFQKTAHQLLRERLDQAFLAQHHVTFCLKKTTKKRCLSFLCPPTGFSMIKESILRLAFSIGSGHASVKHSRLLGEVYDSDLLQCLRLHLRGLHGCTLMSVLCIFQVCTFACMSAIRCVNVSVPT